MHLGMRQGAGCLETYQIASNSPSGPDAMTGEYQIGQWARRGIMTAYQAHHLVQKSQAGVDTLTDPTWSHHGPP